MWAMVLYRKYRPQIFADVVGQEHIREPLLAALKGGKLSHAFLFTGPRGTGKTSVARILAKAVNCKNSELRIQNAELGKEKRVGEPCNSCDSCLAITNGSHLDIMEIDAASNRGIDEIRDLRERIKLSPVAGRYKVYIIDEAHMLTAEAFNALLKTLEEPPSHAIFILATTEPQKIPATIASRSTRFDFKVPSVPRIKEKLLSINQKEGWKLPAESLEEIARAGGGAFRDAEVLLEKIASFDDTADLEKTRQLLGKKDTTATGEFLSFLQKGETKDALVWIDTYVKEGGSVRVLAESILDTMRKLLLIKARAISVIEPITQEELAQLKKLEQEVSKERLLELNDLFNKAINGLRDATIPQLPIELAAIEASLGSEKTEKPVESNKDDQIEEDKPVDKEKEIVTLSADRQGTETRKDTEAPGVEKAKINEEKILKKLKNNWPKFLKELRTANRSLEVFMKDAKPADLDEDLLTLEFTYRFHKDKVEERKYRDVVEEALRKMVGVPLRIKGKAVPREAEQEKSESREIQRPTENIEEVDPTQIFGRLD